MLVLSDLFSIKKIITDQKLVESYNPKPEDSILVYVSSKSKSPSNSQLDVSPTSSLPELSPTSSQPEFTPPSSQPELPTANPSLPNPPLQTNPQPQATSDLFNDPLHVGNHQPNFPNMPNLPDISGIGPSLNIPGLSNDFNPQGPQINSGGSPSLTPQFPSFPSMTTNEPSFPQPESTSQLPPQSQSPQNEQKYRTYC